MISVTGWCTLGETPAGRAVLSAENVRLPASVNQPESYKWICPHARENEKRLQKGFKLCTEQSLSPFSLPSCSEGHREEGIHSLLRKI